MEQLIYFGMGISIISALFAVTSKQIMRSLVALAVFFLSISSIFYLLGSYYLAVAQLLLFLGGIVSLLVLVFNFNHNPYHDISFKNSFWKASLVVFMGLIIFMFAPKMTFAKYDYSLLEFSQTIFGKYGVLLLVGFCLLLSSVMVAVYVLGEKKGEKHD